VAHDLSYDRRCPECAILLGEAGISTQPKTYLTPEEYLAIEREAEFRSEYWNGKMFAISGAREPHNDICVNITAEFRQQLRSRPCKNYSNDMRVRTSSNLYTYPDCVVVCGERRFLDERRDTLLNPNLLVEVLSPSTERYDRGSRFEQYRGIESLREYLMLASDRIHAELFTKQPNGPWTLSEWRDPEDVVPLESCGCRLKLADIYEKVEFLAE
jgi:Uma2 family endonuclease